MGTPVFTPTPPPAEVVEQAVRVIDTWNQLGPIMGLLFVISLAFIAVILVLFSSRNSNNAAITTQANTIAAKDREINEMAAQREQDRKANAENARLLAEQFARSNDLWEVSNKQSENRNLQQQNLVNTQANIARAFDKLLSEGSQPLQKVAADVAQLLLLGGKIDTQTADLPQLLAAIPQLKADINERLDTMMRELEKRSTKPLPAVLPHEMNGGEASPS